MVDIKQLFQTCFDEQRNTLTEYESKLVLEEIGVAIPRQELVDASEDEVISAAEKIGYPVVLKLITEDISHKSDVGAVKLDIKNDDELKEAVAALLAIETAKTPKISVQEMAKKPIAEVIIGMTTDPQFGPALMFGIGGILVELMKDVSFRIVPITNFDADEMIHEIKGFPLLDGFRGKAKVDTQKLVDVLMAISKFVLDFPEVDQMDLNPIFAYEDNVVAVDARIILKTQE
ncbi:MAG TPA: acetate--CoA ligase family protein [Candidatus Lokiarchaeia archaeon]|nr:acetate--CoA ligase family protein [Candidatus Lokiarchaeia archaeon]